MFLAFYALFLFERSNVEIDKEGTFQSMFLGEKKAHGVIS